MTQSTVTEIVSNGFAQRYTNILQTLIVISIAIAGMWGAVIMPLENRLTRLQAEQAELVTLREYDDLKNRSDRADSKLAADIEYLRGNLVSKELHAALRAELESLKSMFGGQYTIADKVKELQHQIEALRTVIADKKAD